MFSLLIVLTLSGIPRVKTAQSTSIVQPVRMRPQDNTKRAEHVRSVIVCASNIG